MFFRNAKCKIKTKPNRNGLIKSLATSRSTMKAMSIGMETSTALTMRTSLAIDIVNSITIAIEIYKET